MSLKQQPPFLICMPIAHSPDCPGPAVRQLEALLDTLGNPAAPALRGALDASRVIHFLSMSVVWDEQGKEPPLLVADVAGDGTPNTIIAALVEHAGVLLLPLFQVAADIDSLAALQNLLQHYWVSPVGASLPLSRHRATGLPFQGTPGLTVEQIKRDEDIADRARAAVLSHRQGGPSAALAYLGAARRATGDHNPRGAPFNYSDAPPTLADAGLGAQAATFLSLIVFDWSFLFIILLVSFFLNALDLLGPLTQNPPGIYKTLLYAIPIAILTGIALNGAIKLIEKLFDRTISGNVLYDWALFTLLPIFLATFASLYVSSKLPTPDFLDNLRFQPFALWVASVLGLLSLVLFLALVAVLLLAVLRHQEEADQPCDADPDPTLLAEVMRLEDQPPHKQNHLIAVSTLKPGLFRRFVALPAGLYASSLTVRSGVFKTGFLSGIGTIHFIQWACLPGTRTLVFTANYDGSWQSYLEDAVTRLPQGASAIWSNAVGFPKTSWLFSAGAKDGDRFKRWVRRQMIPTRFWYSAYPRLTTIEIRLNAAIRCGLKAETMTESQAETWLKLFGSAPRPVTDIETDQIQGVALSGYRNLLEGAVLAVSFPQNPAACRAWLAGVIKWVDFGDAGQSKCATAIALSARGLAQLGSAEPDRLAARFSPPFAMGMASEVRANALGDVSENTPSEWEWGGPKHPVDAALLIYAKDRPTLQARLKDERARCARAGMPPPHEINLRGWPPVRDPNTGRRVPIREAFGFVDGISQPSIQGLRSSRGALATDLLAPGEFILGYLDERQKFPPTPQVFATDDPKKLLPDLPSDFPTQPNKSTRDLGRNGSYLVIRQLKQHVPRYKQYVDDEAARLRTMPDWVGAKMVGRWPNGAPLVLYPQGEPASYDLFPKDEKFLFGRDDPQGLACPFGAHIRRANPRDQFDPNDATQMSITNRHRIIRRGRSYVAGKDSGAEAQGLLFMCLNADIERQFEFLQQTWIGSSAFGPLNDEADPLTAPNRKGGTYTIPAVEGPKQLTDLPSFVSMIGGGYFFLPGRQALMFLSS